jgi:hypothetical protein
VIADRSSAREDDYFYVSVNGGRRKKISLDGDDTIRSLTFKINAALVLDGTADVRRSSEGDMLRIKAAEGSTIELFAGADGRDLLKSMGLQAGAIVNTGSLLDKDEKTSDAPPLHALDLPPTMTIGSLEDAEKAYEFIETAMSKLQRAYRDITMDPALKALLEGPQAGKQGGPVPAHVSAQLANYQAGLARLSGGSGVNATAYF